jgi:large-conductance mechanosensitive channel
MAADLPTEVKRSLAQEFFDFLKTFGVIGLAIAFVIGQAASKLVTVLVNDIITPTTESAIRTSRRSKCRVIYYRKIKIHGSVQTTIKIQASRR